MIFRKMSLALIATLLSLETSAAPQWSMAANVNYTPVAGHTSGLLDGEVPVSGIADLKLADASMTFQGNSFQIKEANSQSPALYGVLMDSDLSTSGKRATYTAVAFLQGGDALRQLANADSQDTVLLTDTTEVAGSIESIDANTVTIGTTTGKQQIDVKKISSIDSPRMAQVALVAQASSNIEPGKPFLADAGNVEVNTNIHRKCAPAKPHKARSMFRRVTSAAPSTYTKTESETHTLTQPAITQTPAPQAEATQPPATCVEGISQPAVIDRVPVAQPVVVGQRRNYWIWGLVGAGVLATAIAVPIACTSHHHSHWYHDYLLQEQELLLVARTPR